jgi:hypothetical protein
MEERGRWTARALPAFGMIDICGTAVATFSFLFLIGPLQAASLRRTSSSSSTLSRSRECASFSVSVVGREPNAWASIISASMVTS